eukprot:3054034-Pyramimonas_sp.AAC.1
MVGDPRSVSMAFHMLSNNKGLAVEALLRCPLTLDIMIDPVVDVNGHTFEREEIEKALRVKLVSPITNKPYPNGQAGLAPNLAVRHIIEEYNKRIGEAHDRDMRVNRVLCAKKCFQCQEIPRKAHKEQRAGLNRRISTFPLLSVKRSHLQLRLSLEPSLQEYDKCNIVHV